MAISNGYMMINQVGLGVHCSDNAKSSRNEASFDCPGTNYINDVYIIYNCVEMADKS